MDREKYRKYLALEDFRTIIWSGERFSLTVCQAAVVRVLFAKARRGVRDVVHGELVAAAGLRCRVVDVFRDKVGGRLVRSQSLGVVVVRSRRGSYRLGIPDEEFSDFRKSLTLGTANVSYDAAELEEENSMFADANPNQTLAPMVANLPRMAARLGVSQNELREMARDGRVPSYPCGRSILFNIADTERALANLAAAPSDVPADPAHPAA